MSEQSSLRRSCWNGALHSYGTSYIFQRRAIQLKKRLQLVNYVGIAVPLVVGALVLSYGAFKALPVIIAVSGAIGVLQVAVNAWAITAGWVDAYSYAIGSVAENDALSLSYQELAENPPAIDELRRRHERLQHEDGVRRARDSEQGVKESEKRYGMRAALRKYQRPCAACNEVPTSMVATTCDVCGKFKYSES